MLDWANVLQQMRKDTVFHIQFIFHSQVYLINFCQQIVLEVWILWLESKHTFFIWKFSPGEIKDF